MTKYRFTFHTERKLTHEEVNELETALWAQLEDLPVTDAVQLVEVTRTNKDLWLEFVVNGLCGLCGNSGVVSTRLMPARHCICPNGRAMLKANKPPKVICPCCADDGKYCSEYGCHLKTP